jgi:hypothetical protein
MRLKALLPLRKRGAADFYLAEIIHRPLVGLNPQTLGCVMLGSRLYVDVLTGIWLQSP